MKISVITVARNAEATITDMLDSIASQRGVEIEHILIDGASRDRTLEIVRQWTAHPIILVSEPDDGIYFAMNKGLELATGDVVGFLNADDLFAETSVLAQVREVFEDETVDACYADLDYVSKDNDNVIRRWVSKPFRKGDFALSWCPAHPTFYMRRRLLQRLGPFDVSFRLAADAEMMMRYLEHGGIASRYVPRTWVRMRIGGQTSQFKNIYRQNREVFSALRKNDLSFSPLVFTLGKILNRIRQFGAARRRGIR